MRRGRSHVLALAVSLVVSLGCAADAFALPGDPCLDCDPGPTDITLTISISGTGSVSQGATVLCTQDTDPCDVTYAQGSSPTLTATPGTGLNFDGWSGAGCSGTGTCSPSTAADGSVTASFADHTPPAVPTISSPTNNQVIQLSGSQTTSVTFAGDSTTAGYRCRLDVADYVGSSLCTSGWNAGTPSTGTHTVYVWAFDSVGNVSAAAGRTFKVVNLPETTLGGTPGAGVLTNSTATAFTYSSPTGTTYICALDGQDVPCNADIGPLGQGDHTFTARAGIAPFGDNVYYYDPSAASRTFTVDSVAPTVAITTGPSDGTSTTDSTAAFQFSGSDPAPGTAITFECSLDGAAFGTCPASYSGLALGAHSFRVRATDEAGNTSAAAARSWTVITLTDTSSGTAGEQTPAPTPQNESQGSGGQAPELPAKAAVAAKLARSFKLSRKGAVVRTLELSGVTPGAAATLRCKGKGCAFKSKKVALKKGAGSLQALFKKKTLKPGTVITITLTHPDMTGVAFTLTVKKKGQPALKQASV